MESSESGQTFSGRQIIWAQKRTRLCDMPGVFSDRIEKNRGSSRELMPDSKPALGLILY
jgi:hypothetical protein